MSRRSRENTHSSVFKSRKVDTVRHLKNNATITHSFIHTVSIPDIYFMCTVHVGTRYIYFFLISFSLMFVHVLISSLYLFLFLVSLSFFHVPVCISFLLAGILSRVFVCISYFILFFKFRQQFFGCLIGIFPILPC